jgi:hypothetical protein
MLATVGFRMASFNSFLSITLKIKIQNYNFTHRRENLKSYYNFACRIKTWNLVFHPKGVIDWGCRSLKCWRENLGVKESNRSLILYTVHRNEIKEDKMNWTGRTHEGDKWKKKWKSHWESVYCLSGELTRPWSRDVMLNAVLKTLPLTKSVFTVGEICMIFDTMGVLPVTQLMY